MCCRNEVGRAVGIQESAGRWGFQGKCDIPLRTLDLFVETVVNQIKPDIIIWTGDNPPHNPWNNNREEAYEITGVFVDLLYKKYKFQGAVYPALGNHEEYITDQYDPFNMERELGFLKNMGDLFRQWLSDQEYEQFIQTGYYTSKYKDSSLRVISFNCFLCDTMNFFLIKNPTDPGNQIEWMEKVLREAEKNGEYVFIAGHIPPGDSTFLSECSKRYNALIDRFSNIIRGQFFGHSHYDEFRVIPEYFNNNNIAGVVLTAPSLTSYSWQNPSFRVFDVDYSTLILKDFVQYRLNLTEANLNPDEKPVWSISYKAKETFGFEHLSDFNVFKNAIGKIMNDNDWLEFIVKSFFSDSITSVGQNIKNKNFPLFISCRFNISIFDDYLKCTHYRTCNYI